MTENGDITILLRQWSGGDANALEGLFSLVYPQLKQIARSLFRGEKPENILQPTVLVNELYLKLLRNQSLKLKIAAISTVSRRASCGGFFLIRPAGKPSEAQRRIAGPVDRRPGVGGWGEP